MKRHRSPDRLMVKPFGFRFLQVGCALIAGFSWRRLAMWAFTLSVIAAGRSEASIIVISTWATTDTEFTLIVMGTAIEDNMPPLTHNIALPDAMHTDNDWVANVAITETPGLINDELSVGGTIRHLIPPPGKEHNEGQNLVALQFQFHVDADDWSGGGHTIDLSMQQWDDNTTADYISGDVRHGSHQDRLKITETKLFWNQTTTFNVDQITTWTLTVRGIHDIAVIPAPGALSFIGLAGLAACRRRRRVDGQEY